MRRSALDDVGNQWSERRPEFESMAGAAAGHDDGALAVDDKVTIGRHRPGMALDQLHLTREIRHAAIEPGKEPCMLVHIGLPHLGIGRPAFLARAESELVADAWHRMTIDAAQPL